MKSCPPRLRMDYRYIMMDGMAGFIGFGNIGISVCREEPTFVRDSRVSELRCKRSRWMSAGSR